MESVIANDIKTAPAPAGAKTGSRRLLSLDLMRGFIMVLLTLESTRLFHPLSTAAQGTIFEGLMLQFYHHPWHGLRFWDLVQPGFMFIAGVAMAFSLTRQKRDGFTWQQRCRKVLKRSFWLFFWGVLDYAVRPTGLSFELWDVLTQLSFTTLVTFLVFEWRPVYHIAVSIGILLLTELLYRFVQVPGFSEPFTNQHNFGNYVDLLLMNKINKGGWVAINCISTTVHTLIGATVGKLLLSDARYKLKALLTGGIVSLILGYGIDALGITPIIKRIATSTFVLASLGWCLLTLAFFYWFVDIRKTNIKPRFFLVFAMNSIFIYLFFEIVGGRWFNDYVGAITGGLLSFTGMNATLQLICTSLSIFALEYLMLDFLYRKKVFFKL
jgi:predicted acyltransferase